MVDELDEDEIPTAPELPHLKCPVCFGTRRRLQLYEDSTRYVGKMVRCDYCDGTGLVTRARFRDHHAIRMGRPPSR